MEPRQGIRVGSIFDWTGGVLAGGNGYGRPRALMLDGTVLSFQAAYTGVTQCGRWEWRRGRTRSHRKPALSVRGALTPAVGDPGWDYSRDNLRQGSQNGSSSTGNGRVSSSRIFARWKWWERKNESALDKDDALPLPMAYPNSEPAPREEVEKAINCDPETQNCKNVVYQWTGECRRCQGTGVVSFYRKSGKEVIGNCIMCLGIGYVHKHTGRDVEQDDIDVS